MAESQSGVTVIGPDTTIKGEMMAETKARILGRFEGTIEAKGSVEVADKAQCHADVNASIVQIDGVMKGNVSASDTVQLNSTARLTGDVTAAKLAVAEGASLDGHFRIGAAATNGRPSGATKPSSPATKQSATDAKDNQPQKK